MDVIRTVLLFDDDAGHSYRCRRVARLWRDAVDGCPDGPFWRRTYLRMFPHERLTQHMIRDVDTREWSRESLRSSPVAASPVFVFSSTLRPILVMSECPHSALFGDVIDAVVTACGLEDRAVSYDQFCAMGISVHPCRAIKDHRWPGRDRPGWTGPLVLVWLTRRWAPEGMLYSVFPNKKEKARPDAAGSMLEGSLIC